MKTHLAAFALAATLATPATAVTFPTLTTIYVGSGVRDNGGAPDVGVATAFHCSNVSGVSTSVRFLVLSNFGIVEGSSTIPIAHGQTLTISTHDTAAYTEDAGLATGAVSQGGVNIESLQSGVFCTAMTIDAAATAPIGVPLHLSA